MESNDVTDGRVVEPSPPLNRVQEIETEINSLYAELEQIGRKSMETIVRIGSLRNEYKTLLKGEYKSRLGTRYKTFSRYGDLYDYIEKLSEDKKRDIMSLQPTEAMIKAGILSLPQGRAETENRTGRPTAAANRLKSKEPTPEVQASPVSSTENQNTEETQDGAPLEGITASPDSEPEPERINKQPARSSRYGLRNYRDEIWAWADNLSRLRNERGCIVQANLDLPVDSTTANNIEWFINDLLFHIRKENERREREGR